MDYKTLKVWQKADELAKEVYSATREFPKEEMFGITSQIRRAALSVPTNIVEGYSRKGDKELARFANIALGSLAETEYLLSFSYDIGLLPKNNFEKLSKTRAEVGKMLWSFYQKVKE